jgi:hypothetical protein
VHLIYDIDLLLRPGRSIDDFVPDGAHIVNAVVGGSVDLEHVHAVAGEYFAAYIALVAGFSILGIQAVDRTGEYMGHRGFAGTPGPAEKVGMGDSSRTDAVSERFHHVFLFYHITKPGRSPFSVQSNVGHHQQPFFRTISMNIVYQNDRPKKRAAGKRSGIHGTGKMAQERGQEYTAPGKWRRKEVRNTRHREKGLRGKGQEYRALENRSWKRDLRQRPGKQAREKGLAAKAGKTGDPG